MDVKGHGGAGMAKLGLDIFNVLSLLDQKAGVGVAEVMEPDLSQRDVISPQITSFAMAIVKIENPEIGTPTPLV